MRKVDVPNNLPVYRPNLYDVPIREAGLYSYTEGRRDYRLTPGGIVLNRVRSALRDGVAVRLSASLDIKDWYRIVDVATAPERRELLKLRAAEHIAITRTSP